MNYLTEDQIRAMTYEVKTCVCGALIEELDGGGFSYWLHVKRLRINYDHAAIPAVMPFTVEELKALANGLATMEEDYGDTQHHDLYVRVSEELDMREIQLESAETVHEI